MMRCFENQIKAIEASKKVYRKKKVKLAHYLKTLKSRVSYLEGQLKKMGASFDAEGNVTVVDNIFKRPADVKPSTSVDNNKHIRNLSACLNGVQEMEVSPSEPNTSCASQSSDRKLEEVEEECGSNLSQIFPRVNSDTPEGESDSSNLNLRVMSDDLLFTGGSRVGVHESEWEEDEEMTQAAAAAVNEVFPSPVKQSQPFKLSPESPRSQEVHFKCTDSGYMQVFIKSVTLIRGTDRSYGIACWFTEGNPLNDEIVLLSPSNESQTTRIELDINAAMTALNTVRQLSIARIILYTESKYLPRITLNWLKTNQASSWDKVKTIFKNIKCLDTLFKLIQEFEDVKFVQVSPESAEMKEMHRILYKKSYELVP